MVRFLSHPFPSQCLASDIPDKAARRETVKWVRAEFERNRHLHDVVRPVLTCLSAFILLLFAHQPSRMSSKRSLHLAVGNYASTSLQ
jgi:hypothetical protein